MGRGRTGTGLEIREKSIRLNFVYEGNPVRETLTLNGAPLPPTPANIKYATRIAGEVRRHIAQGTFNLAEYFPDSPRAKEVKPATFGELADMWVKSKGQLQAATLDQYSTALRLWKNMFGKDTPMSKLTPQMLKAKIGEYPWPSPKTANNYLIALRGIFEFEYSGRRQFDNPMLEIKNLVVVKKLPDPLTSDERDMILAELSSRYDPRVWAYFAFAFFTGMRPEEMIALRWADIDFIHGIARVQRVRTFKGSERDGSKTHAERDVDLVGRALEALTVMKPYTYMKNGDIFENPLTGKPWHDERSQRDTYWTPTLKRLGIRYRRAYNTRHTYATSALMGGVKPGYIASQLGHATSKMLFEKYSRWIEGADKGAERRALNEAFGSNSSPELPQKQTDQPNLLIRMENSGRRDWTRTK